MNFYWSIVFCFFLHLFAFVGFAEESLPVFTARGIAVDGRLDEAAWRAQIRRIFGKTADEVLAIEEKARKNDPEKHAARLTRILSNWDEITRIMDEELPDYASLLAKAEAVGMPLRPSDLGLPVRDAVDAFLGSRDIRDKYLTSSMLWDLGLTDEYADKVAEVCEE